MKLRQNNFFNIYHEYLTNKVRYNLFKSKKVFMRDAAYICVCFIEECCEYLDAPNHIYMLGELSDMIGLVHLFDIVINGSFKKLIEPGISSNMEVNALIRKLTYYIRERENCNSMSISLTMHEVLSNEISMQLPSISLKHNINFNELHTFLHVMNLVKMAGRDNLHNPIFSKYWKYDMLLKDLLEYAALLCSQLNHKATIDMNLVNKAIIDTSRGVHVW